MIKKITLLDYKSPLWEVLRGGYGDTLEDVKMLMERKDKIALENLCDNILHQLSFYEATYVVMPYLVTLLEEKQNEQDFKWQVDLIVAMGNCIMTDISRNHYKVLEDKAILTNYQNSIHVLQYKTKTFLKDNLEQIKQLEQDELVDFYTAVLAILGDREAAFVLTSMMFEECSVVCEHCEFCDEDMQSFSEGKPESIMPIKSVIGKWDEKGFEDTYLWFSNFVHILGDHEVVDKLSYYYGVYTCPECGEQGEVMKLMKKYFGL